jgi:hypothetical protein
MTTVAEAIAAQLEEKSLPVEDRMVRALAEVFGYRPDDPCVSEKLREATERVEACRWDDGCGIRKVAEQLASEGAKEQLDLPIKTGAEPTPIRDVDVQTELFERIASGIATALIVPAHEDFLPGDRFVIYETKRRPLAMRSGQHLLAEVRHSCSGMRGLEDGSTLISFRTISGILY